MIDMGKRFRLLIALLLVACCTQAQTDSLRQTNRQPNKCDCGFASYFNFGVLEGEARTALLFQTIQGMRFGKWFTGIGAGLEYYFVRTVPVFVDVRRTLLNRRYSPFAYADAGMHFPWARDKDQPVWGGKSKYNNGLWYDVGVGYRFALGKETALLLSAGYSHLAMKETRSSNSHILWKFNRLSLKVGISL
jgi:hypothetical protein